MTDEVEKVIKKIEKLLALAGGMANENESQVAMAKAQELMIQHGIVQGDLKKFTESDVKDIPCTNREKSQAWWKRKLATIIAENFRCFSYTMIYNDGKESHFVGLEEDVNIALEVYKFAVSAIKYNSTLYIREWRKRWSPWATELKKAKAIQNDWIMGFLQGLWSMFKEQVEKNNWGLMIVKDSLVLKKKEDMNLSKSRKTSVSSNKDYDAFNSGYNTGNSFDANRTKIGV